MNLLKIETSCGGNPVAERNTGAGGTKPEIIKKPYVQSEDKDIRPLHTLTLIQETKLTCNRIEDLSKIIIRLARNLSFPDEIWAVSLSDSGCLCLFA